jgi:hypothetical protein
MQIMVILELHEAEVDDLLLTLEVSSTVDEVEVDDQTVV